MPRDAPVTNATRGSEAGVGHARPQRSSALPHVRPAPKPEQQHEVAVVQAAVVGGLGERERDRRRRRVAVALDVHERALRRDAEPVGGGLDDAEVGLVGHEPVDVVDGRRRPRSSVAVAESTTTRTARRNTSWPCIFR